MSLLLLESSDFNIKNSEKGPILCTEVQGLSMIFFYSMYCTYCQQSIPLYKVLPKYITGCNFGLLNIDENKECYLKSTKTITKIEEVPLYILYYNGHPIYQYNGEISPQHVHTFISDIANKIQMNLHKKTVSKNPSKKIPEYTIGNPIKGSTKINYMEFKKAYTPDQK